MAEEKQEKKRSGIIRRILKWIGLAVLSLLLILAILLQAPWKIITLLFVVLAACAILPKHLRKWFWLSAAAVIVVLIIWVFMPDDNEGWRPYTFDEELAALEAQYAVPDEENAAILYNQLLEDYNEATFKPYFGDPNVEYLTRSKPWSSNDYPQVAEWLKSHEKTIAKLIEASKFEKCRFPIVADFLSFGQHIEILAPIRGWSFLLVCASNNDLAEGRFDQAIEKNLTVLQMAKHICQQPADLDVMVGFALEDLGLRDINNFLVWADANESHLGKIEQAVSAIRHDLNSDLLTFIALEKLTLKNTFGSLFYEVNSKGKARLSRDPLAIIREQAKEQLAKGMWDNDTENGRAMQKFLRPPGFWVKRGEKVLTILLWLFVPRTPEKLSRIVNDGFEKLYIMTKPDFDWSKEPKEVPIESFVQFKFKLDFRRITELMAQSNEKLYFGLHDNYLRNSVKQRGTLLIIALRRYKNTYSHWPENLEEVKSFAPAEIFVDPINGDSFVYKLTEDNFTLYSTGKNAIDEGGQYESKWDPNTYEHMVEKDDRLIWPRRSRKIKEEKADDEQQ